MSWTDVALSAVVGVIALNLLVIVLLATSRSREDDD
jgi:hypothetical protein